MAVEQQDIDISVGQAKIIKDLFKRYLPNTTVWVYGSRANGTAQLHSDLDMVAFVEQPQAMDIFDLKEAFDESDLPFRVDFFIWDNIPDNFHHNIQANHIVFQEKSTKNNAHLYIDS